MKVTINDNREKWDPKAGDVFSDHSGDVWLVVLCQSTQELSVINLSDNAGPYKLGNVYNDVMLYEAHLHLKRLGVAHV